MFKMRKLIYILLIIICFGISKVEATDNHIPIRVGISNNNFQAYTFSNIEFIEANHLQVMDSATGYCVPISETAKLLKVTSEDNLFRIYLDGTLVARNLTGPILVRPTDGYYVNIANLKRKGKQAFYRGYIELVRSSKDISKFSIVNVLSLKNYLRGVVPNEMPTRFGLEALKAQTVAARNYAITPRVKAYKEFDVCDSVACQVYFGANTEETLSDLAIDETNGIIAIDREYNPILALYSSTAGGHTESYEYAFSDPVSKAFPSKSIHYLTGIADNNEYEDLSTDEAAENFYMSKPDAFDDLSPYYRWSRDWTVDELQKVLSKTLVAQSKTGFVTPKLLREEDFGNLLSIKSIMRGKSGKIIKLQINTTKNTFIVEKELVIRRCFQKDGNSIPSANFVITYINSKVPVYKLSGGGFGHGVGLSQWGAGKMSSLKYTFDQILQHYYQGIKLSTIPVKIYPNRQISDRIFYSNNKDIKVIVKSDIKTDRLKITVNNRDITVKIKDKITEIDISRYTKMGLNSIAYYIDDNNVKNSAQIEAFVIVKEAKDE